MFHNDMRTQNINNTVRLTTKSTNTDHHLTGRRDKQETIFQQTRQRNPLLWKFCSNTVLVRRVSHYLQTDAALVMS